MYRVIQLVFLFIMVFNWRKFQLSRTNTYKVKTFSAMCIIVDTQKSSFLTGTHVVLGHEKSVPMQNTRVFVFKSDTQH